MTKGKGRKTHNQSKKGQANAKAATQSGKPNQSNNTTKSTVGSKANLSQDLNCELCGEISESVRWFVQCDDCDKHFHFECVGITTIADEDPWSCTVCTQNTQKPEVKESDVQPNEQSKSTNDKRSLFAQNIKCKVCNEQSKEWLRYVRCDECHYHIHFTCVGITEFYDEEPWSCNECVQKRENNDSSAKLANTGKIDQIEVAHSITIQSSIEETSSSTAQSDQTPQIIVVADVQTERRPTIQDVLEDEHGLLVDVTNIQKRVVDQSKLQNATSSSSSFQVKRSDVQKTSTRATSLNPHFDQKSTSSKSRTNSSNTKSTTSSQRQDRVQAELALQQQIDQDLIIAMRMKVAAEAAIRIEELKLEAEAKKLKLEAEIEAKKLEVETKAKELEAKRLDAKAEEELKLMEVELKEKREKRFLNDQAKSRTSHSGSIRSTSSNHTNRTSYDVASWADDQQKRLKARSLDNNDLRKDVEFEFTSSKNEDRQNITSRSVDENIQRFRRNIDKTNLHHDVDYSITLDEEEREDLLSRRQRGTSPVQTIQHDKVWKPMANHGTLKANVQSFIPKSQSSRKFSEGPPETKPKRFQDYFTSKPGPIQHQQTNASSLMSKPNPKNMNQTHNMQSYYQTQPCYDQWLTKKNNPNITTVVSSYQNGVQSDGHFQSTKIPSDRLWQQTRIPTGQQPIVATSGPCYQSYTQTSGPRYQTYTQHTNNSQFERHPQSVESMVGQNNPSITTPNQVTMNKNHEESSIGLTMAGEHDSSFQAPLTARQIATRQAMGREPLPDFNGNPTQWRRFIMNFENSTKNCGFSDVENIRRLDKCLKDKARQIVECQLMMPECVSEIIDTLRQKFGRPEIVVKAVLAEVRSEPVIKPDKLEVLSDYGYKVRNACKTIQYLKMTYHLYNPELVQELVDKLPYQTKLEWARYSENLPQVSLIELSDWLYVLSKSINRITMPEISIQSIERKPDRKYENSKSESSKGGYVNIHDSNANKTINDNQKTKVKTCVTCAKTCKFVGECPKFKGLSVEGRWKTLFENKLCRSCLRKHGGSCRNSKECEENGCTARHHPLMHNDKRNPKDKPNPSNQPIARNDRRSPAATTLTSGSSNTHHNHSQDTLFRIVPVEVHNHQKSFLTFAFLDEGSTFTMIERHVAREIDLKGTPEMICLLWTNKVSRLEQSELANLEISGVDMETSPRYQMRSVNIVDNLDLPTQTLNQKDMIQRFPHLRRLPLTEFKNVKPTMIIGLKHARLSTPLETFENEENGPIATRCRLGWSIHGPVSHTNVGYVHAHRISQCSCQDRDDDLHNIIKEHFTVENFGVAASSISLESKENERALELLKKSTVRKGTRFETRLLWKDEAIDLPDSYPMAMRRLSCLENKGTETINIINDFVKDYMEKGYVSKLTPDVIDKKDNRTWYLPLFTIVHPKKPEKIRPVFDAAARVKGISLNSALFTGPDLSVSIVDILRRFREHPIAICGDIREMFHQVSVHKDDRNSQRFLWRNGEKNRKPDVYVMNVMTFGATCSPSAAQFVKNINAEEFQKEYPRAAEAIIKNHYVDDLMDGAETVKDATQLVNDVKFVHRQGGFEIRNFKSSSRDLLRAIGEPVNVDEKVSVESGPIVERVLGMFWDTRLDCFTFSLKYAKATSGILSGKQLPTKREALRLLMSIFDPLGLLSYYLIHLKILIQDVWRSQAKWDDQITEELREKWIRWVEILPNVTKLQIPRCYSNNLLAKIPKTVEMHVFVDAGEEAFAAVVYLKIETKEKSECSLVGSKARVAPLKYLSIPRKELQAAILGTRLMSSICIGQTFKVDRRIIWSDSETVLSWLKSNTRNYSQFVAHRVGEILENTNVNEWRWIPSKQNIADEATKWSKEPTFDSSNRWFKGPDFIHLSEDQWPKKKIIKQDVEEEMKIQLVHSKFVVPQLIDSQRFSNWNRMVRALAYAIRFRKSSTGEVPKGAPLTQEELSRAENLVYRQAQFEKYPAEMVTLERNKTLTIDKYVFIEKPSPLFEGSPYLDAEGVLRMKGRIDGHRDLSLDTKRPIILPKNSRITTLLLHQYHTRYFHQNHETAINEIRQRFYIPHLRTVFKKVKNRCQMCKVKRAHPQPPQMADLPPARLATRFSPFSYVGIDYFGPMYVVVGRSRVKRWGVLFTCLTIRAVHIELADSLDTKECISCIGNFINRHGTPIEIHSDCGSNMKGADNELQRERKKIDDAKLSTEFTNMYTKWIFTAPTAAHMGGSWERLIRSVKSGLEEIMPTRTPKESMLRNLLLEVANVVNSRPLTYIPLDSIEDEALTPNHFILGTSNGHKPPCMLNLDGPYLRQSWKESQRLTELFWKRFIREYLPTITRRTKWFKPIKPLQEGDVVLIVDPDSPRNTNPKARVLETKIGSNGQVRRAKLDIILEAKTDSKGRICKVRRSELWRPTHKLAVLDVVPNNEESLVQTDGDVAPKEDNGLAQPNVYRKTGGSVGALNSNVCAVPSTVQLLNHSTIDMTTEIDDKKKPFLLERKQTNNKC